ncbi:MAG TPA: aminopeptidase [Gemmatimonadaceae bacterium]|nr:aminopeptidase [Gemmatimonadaceae bacterium]
MAALLALVLFLAAPVGRYLIRAAWEEGMILRHRRPIADVVASPATDARTRGKLRLVLAARAFAADSVRLRAGESFTTFSPLAHDTLVLVLSGAFRDRLKPYTWWFPVVGRVPYKGFFDFAAAKEAARTLDRRGYDVYLRPSPAFSTLGWFNDPLLSTSLREDSLDLANTVIHELTHNTFYAPGQAVFNESFANFVGSRGAAWFFRSRGDSAAAAKVDARWADERVIGAFYSGVYHALDSAFKARPGEDAAARADRLRARDTIYARARRFLADSVAPALHAGPLPRRWAERVKLDNAAVLARRIYLTDLQLFDAVYDAEGRDLRRTIARVIALAKSRPKDPYGAVREWVERGTGDAGRGTR